MADPIESVTVNQGYQLPDATNPTAVDVLRLISALNALDNDIALLFAAMLVKAGLNSPTFSGTPTAPTQPAGTNDNSIATTGHVQLALNAFLSEAASALETISALEAALGDADLATALLDQLALKAPLASPIFTGVPRAPTAATDDNGDQIATTAFVQAVKAVITGAVPTALNSLQKQAAAVNNDPNFSTTMATALGLKAPLASPAFTGSPTAPTQPLGDLSTKLATTGFVQAALGDYDSVLATALAAKAPLASPAFTGAPTAPTQAAGNNTTRIATTAFVAAALDAISSAITSDIAAKAPLASPALTGTPTAPTQAAGNNSTRIATTAYVVTGIANAIANLVSNAISVIAGNGLTGGGTLAASRTLTVGQGTGIAVSATTVSVDSTVWRDGNLPSAAQINGIIGTTAGVYTGSVADNTAFPVGHVISVITSPRARNSAATIYLYTSGDEYYTVSSGGAALAGTWRMRGHLSSDRALSQRTA